ncbi:hypothetical protein EPN44_05815, partial [bacterium]
MSIYKRKPRSQTKTSGGRGARRQERYVVTVDTTEGSRRRRHYAGTYRTKEAAESAERIALGAQEKGIALSPAGVTVKEIVERYLADRRLRLAPKTMERYDDVARLYVLPHLGAIRVAKLKPKVINAWLAR